MSLILKSLHNVNKLGGKEDSATVIKYIYRIYDSTIISSTR